MTPMSPTDAWSTALAARLTDPKRLTAAARLWQDVLAAMRRRVGTRRLNDWARAARLVSLSEEEAVVAFPDRAARDGALASLHPALQDAIRNRTNRKTRVEFVVDANVLPRCPLPPAEAARRDGTRRMKRPAPADLSSEARGARGDLSSVARSAKGDADPAAEEALRLCREFLAQRGRAPKTFFVWGPAGTGKSRFLDLVREALSTAGRDVVSMGGDHFRSLAEAARRQGRLAGLRARLSAAQALLLDDVHRWARAVDGRVDLADLLSQPWLVAASEAPLAELSPLRRALVARGGAVVEARLSGPGKETSSPTTVEDVIEAVAMAYAIPATALVEGRKGTSEARHVCLYLARKVAGVALATAARQVGGRTRGSAHRATAQIEARLSGDAVLRRRVEAIEAGLA